METAFPPSPNSTDWKTLYRAAQDRFRGSQDEQARNYECNGKACVCQDLPLVNYPFLTPCAEIKKAKLYGVSTGAIVYRVSDTASVEVRRNTPFE
jgi:hypothetical protein